MRVLRVLPVAVRMIAIAVAVGNMLIPIAIQAGWVA